MTQHRITSAPKPLTSLNWMKPLSSAALVLAASLISISPALAGEHAKKAGTSTKADKHATWSQGGVASYYSRSLHGGPTASGERYNQNVLTAAHKTLPMNTLVEVTRADTGKKVIVRINDRGPFIKGRVIDLSMAAAKNLDMVNRGIAKVSLRILPSSGKLASVEEAMVLREAEITKEKKDFAIALASFESKAEAKQFRERMLAVELEDAVVKKIREDSGVKYRVEIPGFDSEVAARTQRDEFSKQLLNRKPQPSGPTADQLASN